MARTALLNVMVNAVLKAGRGLARDFGEVENLQVSLKGPGDFVSAADRRAEQVLMTELQKARPSYGFLAEESGETEGQDRGNRWIIDPLDGTMNFLHGIPIFAISVALEREGQIVAGVIFNPVMNELYTAEKGTGIFLNDRRLRVARRSKLEDAVVVTGMPQLVRPGQDAYLAELRVALSKTAGVRRTGSAAMDLAWVASGRFDGMWQHGLSAWDIAAGLLFVREAGGYVTDAAGHDTSLVTGTVVAGIEAIHRQLLALVASAEK